MMSLSGLNFVRKHIRTHGHGKAVGHCVPEYARRVVLYSLKNYLLLLFRNSDTYIIASVPERALSSSRTHDKRNWSGH